MRIRAVLTDLDGTLLEPDGSLAPEAREALRELSQRGVPVVPLTSKTRRELADWLGVHDCGRYGSFEKRAGVLTPRGVEIAKGAPPVAGPRTPPAPARSEARRLLSVARLSDSPLREPDC